MNAVVGIGPFVRPWDIVVIGAGPAGMSAASEAAGRGASVLLVDENASPGGQIYRAIRTTPVPQSVLGADFFAGRAITEVFDRSGASYAPRATLWSLKAPEEAGGEFELGLSSGGSAQLARARQVIVATGAMERPMPVTGWTLPGVMTAGAAQIALKSSGAVPAGRVAIAGCGPLLYLIAEQLTAAGADIVVVAETTPWANWRAAARHLAGFVGSPYLRKGLKLIAGAVRRLRILRAVDAIRLEGQDKVQRLVARRGAGETVIDCDTVLLHQGVVPNITVVDAIGGKLDWDEEQLAFRPRLDAFLETTVPGVAVCGDGGGIAGADAAPHSGRLAAIGALARLGRITAAERDALAGPARAAFAQATRGRAFLDRLYRPPAAFRIPQDDGTIVCRCEEVTTGQLREALALGAQGPNQLKVFTRCGMGPCQGRLCGLTVTELSAEHRGVSPAEVGGYRARPPFKPVTVGEIASLPKTNAAVKAVVR